MPKFYTEYFLVKIINIFIKKEEQGISVIIPCYNQARYLIESVQSIINQDYKKFEIIIINDASTDNTRQIASKLIDKYKNFKIRLIENKQNLGLAESRNTGIKKSNYELIYLLDADDKIDAKALKIMYMFMKFYHASMVCPGVIKFGDINSVDWKKVVKTQKEIFKHHPHYGSLINKKAWKMVEGYNKNMLYGWEDWNFTLSFIENNLKIITVAKPLCYYRRYNNSMLNLLMRDEEKRRKMLIRLIKNHPKLYSRYSLENIICKFKYQKINNELFRKELEKLKFIKK